MFPLLRSTDFRVTVIDSADADTTARSRPSGIATGVDGTVSSADEIQRAESPASTWPARALSPLPVLTSPFEVWIATYQTPPNQRTKYSSAAITRSWSSSLNPGCMGNEISSW